MINELYWFCTDFCVNAANLLGITYVEFNAILFIFLMPLIVVVLTILNIIKYALGFKNNKSGA